MDRSSSKFSSLSLNKMGMQQGSSRFWRVNHSEFMPLPMFGLKNAPSTISLNESNPRFRQESTFLRHKSNEQSNASVFGSAVNNAPWNSSLRIQERTRPNEEYVDEVFRRPALSNVIKGRSSTMSYRLFSQQCMDRGGRSMDCTNGFNISHISKKGGLVLSESRFRLENQSVARSVVSLASVKAQFVNLLEDLHHSISNIAPNFATDAVRMEFDKVKGELDNINETNFIPTIKELDSASVISHSSKFPYPPISEQTSKVVEKASIPLKTGEEIFKTLVPNVKNSKKNASKMNEKTNEKNSHVYSCLIEKGESIKDEESILMYKKPKPFFKFKKKSPSLKIKTPKLNKSSTGHHKKKGTINLKQWYPITIDNKLGFCGINDEGVIVKTEAVADRISNRKVELANGLNCNLIGNPSKSIVYPKKIATLIKRGLDPKWDLLLKELLAENNQKKSPNSKRVKGNSESAKKTRKKSPKSKNLKNIVQKHHETQTMESQKNEEGVRTRSGRMVKPPTMFWLLSNEKEVQAPSVLSTPRNVKKGYVRKSPKKAFYTTPKLNRKDKKSPFTSNEKLSSVVKSSNENSAKSPKSKKVKSIRRSLKFTTETVAQQNQESTPLTRNVSNGTNKRKRESIGDPDICQKKKPKTREKTVANNKISEKNVELKRGKSNKNKTRSRAKNLKNEKLQEKTKNQNYKEESTTEISMMTESRRMNEVQDEFELQLNDIQIPEFANIKSRPQLNRRHFKMISMETPPLKYFNNTLKLLRTATPENSPNWYTSQRTESEVKRFQKRQAEAQKKNVKVKKIETIISKTKKGPRNDDLRKVMEWVEDKNVRSPQYRSKVLQYVIPSRKQMEEEYEDEDEDMENEFS